MAGSSAHAVEDRGELAILRGVLEKNATALGSMLGRGAQVVRRGAARLAPATAVAPAARVIQGAAPAAKPLGQSFRAGLNEFTSGLRSGRAFGVGPAEAAKAAPSLWRSVGHNMADQAVGGAIGGTVIGGALGAYQAPKGDGLSGALAGAGQGVKAGLVGGALAGGAGGALRHGRYKALLHAGQTPAQAAAVMSKSPLQNVQDAWKNRETAGAWHADALEAAAVPATLALENMAQGIGETKQQKTAELAERIVAKIAADGAPAPKTRKRHAGKRSTRAAVHLSRVEEMQLITAARAILRAVRDSKPSKIKIAGMPQVVVVPMMHGSNKTPAELEAERRDRAAYETDKAVGKGVGPLVGAVGAEALLRGTVDPLVRDNPTGPLKMLTPDSVPRKILLPGIGAALGAYGAHRLIQSRREERERQSQALAAQDAAAAALPAPPVPESVVPRPSMA